MFLPNHNPNHWRLGIFYFNRQDRRLRVRSATDGDAFGSELIGKPEIRRGETVRGEDLDLIGSPVPILADQSVVIVLSESATHPEVDGVRHRIGSDGKLQSVGSRCQS